MLKPEPMRRVLIVVPRADARTLIETLHDRKVAQIVEHRKGHDELDIGRPLPEGSSASERIVRLRALLRQLGAEEHQPARALPVRDIESRLDPALARLEVEVGAAAERLSRAETARGEKDAEKTKLAPLTALPLRLADYRGYESVRVLVGRVADDPTADVERAADGAAEVFLADDLVAVFVPKDKGDATQNALFTHGFKEIEVPPGEGTPAERVRELDGEVAGLDREVAEARARLAKLREEWADFLKAAEEHLAIEVEKAEAPLGFGATEHAFVLEAWVPEGSSLDLVSALNASLKDRYHLEWVPIEAEHGVGAQINMHGADQESQAPEKAHEVPPTKFRNPAAARPFEFFTSMFSTPRYGEIDPTMVLAVAFPIFFGFMIGDFGLGLIMLILGVTMARKLRRVDGMPQLGTAIAIAGAVALVTGGVVFQDAFGIPFDVNHHMEEELELAHLEFACNPAVYEVLHETTWSCLISGHAWHLPQPLILKTIDVKTMLLVSLLAALVHLALGLVFGIFNEIHHSGKHALAKVGWLILLGGFFIAALGLLDFLGDFESTGFLIAGGSALVAAVILVATEGGLAILEIPSMFSNILSYLRLGAVAIAKGAMAVAFNGLTLLAAVEAASGEHANVVVVVLGLIGFVVAQMVLFVLGVLSSGIQAIRLNYVEFFTKFYKGGGQPFRPFGQPRQFTTES